MMMARFDDAVTAGEKLLELVNWFDGAAKRIIISQMTRSAKNAAYAAARYQMDKLFKVNVNSFQVIVADLVKGRRSTQKIWFAISKSTPTSPKQRRSSTRR